MQVRKVGLDEEARMVGGLIALLAVVATALVLLGLAIVGVFLGFSALTLLFLALLAKA